jgi:hypothetical protein
LKIFPFATGVNDIGDAPQAANISANFQKNDIIRGLGETDPFRKPEVKISWHFPFKGKIARPKKLTYTFLVTGKLSNA